MSGNYANKFFIESSSSSIIFNTDGRTSTSTPNMIVHSTGNVGIGITNPNCRLYISSNLATSATVYAMRLSCGTLGQQQIMEVLEL